MKTRVLENQDYYQRDRNCYGVFGVVVMGSHHPERHPETLKAVHGGQV